MVQIYSDISTIFYGSKFKVIYLDLYRTMIFKRWYNIVWKQFINAFYCFICEIVSVNVQWSIRKDDSKTLIQHIWSKYEHFRDTQKRACFTSGVSCFIFHCFIFRSLYFIRHESKFILFFLKRENAVSKTFTDITLFVTAKLYTCVTPNLAASSPV